jgi:hypothetical protein
VELATHAWALAERASTRKQPRANATPAANRRIDRRLVLLVGFMGPPVDVRGPGSLEAGALFKIATFTP